MKKNKQSSRRRLAQLRAEFHSAPWSIDIRALGMLDHALTAGDIEGVKATLALGQDSCDSIVRMVGNVAVIPVTGVLCDEMSFMVRYGYASSYQQIEREFLAAIGNAQVKAILFYFDTPGGSAIGCKRVSDIIFASRGQKPIRAFTQKLCCSAGYYMAAACDQIDATADALGGSIGTIYTHFEMSGFLKEIGYSANVITNSGSPKKGHGNMYEPLSDAAKQTLQAYVESYGRPFINDVARYRGISPDKVIANYGQGDSLRADVAAKQGVIDNIVARLQDSIDSLAQAAGTDETQNKTPVVAGEATGIIAIDDAKPSTGKPESGTSTGQATTSGPAATKRSSAMNERIKAQLFALGLIDSLDASDKECKAALNAWHKARGIAVPADEAKVLESLQSAAKSSDSSEEDPADDDEEKDDDTEDKSGKRSAKNATKIREAHNAEQSEARLESLTASAKIVNDTLGQVRVTDSMILQSVKAKHTPAQAMKAWSEVLSEAEPPIPTDRIDVRNEAASAYVRDVVDALVYKAASSMVGSAKKIELSDNAAPHVRKPLWAIAGECLSRAGHTGIDMYGDREYLAEAAMQMGTPGQRHVFFSPREKRQYIQAASGAPMARPGDFPNILSAMANKFLDTIELDQDYSYPQISAMLPGGLSDFKPAIMINKGIVEELDELQDAEQFKELGLSEEVLSYIFLRRFGNKWGWTPVMIANDDLGAFVEGMIGLEEAWQVTQNRMVVDRYTANENLLDGSALFADRTNTGTGSNPALNNNDIASGGSTPSDAQWAAMEAQYADIGGVATGRRVRGTINVCFCPTGIPAQEARRTFLPLNTGGLEMKVATTTATVGLYRGEVQVVPESELRVSSLLKWYGLRNPTRLNTATVVRGYFNGFGEAGRRERWYDPETKTTWTSIEGRIAVAVKNWRYAIRNKGAA
jgi:ClpP class serine protease